MTMQQSSRMDRLTSQFMPQSRSVSRCRRHRVSELSKFFVVSFAVLILAGCSDSDGLDRKAIYGEVQPPSDRDGVLVLIPDEATKAPTVSTPITGGKYQFDKASGPVPGSYQATVRLKKSASEISAPAQNAPGAGPPGKGPGRVALPAAGGNSPKSNPSDTGDETERQVPLKVPATGDLKLDLKLS